MQLLDRPQFSMTQLEKESLLIPALSELTHIHRDRCPPYRRVLDAIWPGAANAQCLEDLPFLPVSLFKTHELKSALQSNIRMTMMSSGTTGMGASRIAIDAETSRLQSLSLAASIKTVLGPQRPPMLIVDTPDVVRDPRLMTARGAGVLGMMRFGRDHVFALDKDMRPDTKSIEAFLERHAQAPFFMFGFTFMVWLYLYESVTDGQLNLENATLVHSGGWKKLEDRKVDNLRFRTLMKHRTGLKNIFNFYGMVEQLGSIFLEGEDGALYAPNVSDVIIRDLRTLEPLPPGKEGIIQVLSVLPRSYPGHSLLTEDIGVLRSVDSGAGGRLGKAISVLGRVPKVELRGCSDVYADALSARTSAA